MKTFIGIWFILTAQPTFALSQMTAGFDHQAHLSKVFKPNKIDCMHCHNFNMDQKEKRISFSVAATKSILNRPVKEICHECHRSDLSQYKEAPKACFTCHKGMEDIKKIKPVNHESISWRNSHSLEAKVKGESCNDCHAVSQCSKCHLRRNDIDLQNHPKNYRFYHSVQARAQPQRCDACHTKSYCADCHLGVK